MSNHVFNDVVKASDDTGLIQVYLNESHFIIQRGIIDMPQPFKA